MKEPLISIIVPVYGVEKYLTQCVQSLINQTYKNLEIILVDDGSPENSDFDEDLDALGEFIAGLKNVQRVEVLPYHTLGLFKWENLGIKYALEGISPPEDDRVENANRRLRTAEYTGYKGNK